MQSIEKNTVSSVLYLIVSPGVGKRGTKLKNNKPRGFAGGLDGRQSQTRVMPMRVEEDQAQAQYHEIESVCSALHAEMCDDFLVLLFLTTVSW